jgi:integrase
MIVKLLTRKLKDGRESLYLEYYKGYSKTKSGKIKHKREKENLQLYLFGNPKNANERQQNKETNDLANKIFIKRQAEINDGKYGFNNDSKANVNLIDYFTELTDKRKESKGNYGNWDACKKQLMKYCDPDTTTFKDVDEKFVKGFKEFLLNKPLIMETRKLALNSAHSYFNKFKACMNQAFDDRIINDNPSKRVKGITPEDPEREYLTLEEIQKIAKIECRYEVLKRAFLFSCITGLRWSDVNKLLWSKVQKFNGGCRITFTQKKTKGLEYLDISQQAREFMGEEGKPEDRVFKGLRYSSYMNLELQKWCMKAGITKNITFHSARHTFATLQLTLGTDIYTVSKLLGNKNLKTTQIYTKIIDQKKIDAIEKIPMINIENLSG